jgi:hypothetical protein
MWLLSLASKNFVLIRVGIIAGRRKASFTSGRMIYLVLVILFHLILNCMGLYPHNTR